MTQFAYLLYSHTVFHPLDAIQLVNNDTTYRYDFITCGAATAYALGFKNGGLLKQITARSEAMTDSACIIPCIKAAETFRHASTAVYREIDKLMADILGAGDLSAANLR